jgi:hypothetical protein
VLYSLFVYLKMYVKYFILRQTEFFIKYLSRWLNESTIKKYIYLFIGLWGSIQLIVTTVIIIAGWFFLNNYISNESLILIFFLYILISSIFDGFFISERVLSPFDEKILAVSPFNNREMFLFIFLSEFFIKKFVYYSSLFIISSILVITISDLSWSFIIAVLGSIFVSTAITFLSTVFKCLLQVRRVKKGYKIEPLFYILFLGLFICFVTIVIFQSIFKWIQNVPGFWIINNWGKLLLSIIEHVDYYINLKKYIPTIDIYLMRLGTSSFTSNDILPFTLWIIILLLLALYAYLSAGKWYRQTWQFESYFQKDWFYNIEKIFLYFTKETIKKVQIKNLLRDRTQLSHHFALFYGHYFNYFYIGIAIAAEALPVEKDSYLRFFIVFFLFYRIAVDAFDSMSLYPDLLRFDSEGKRLRYYRMANLSFIEVYKAKIYVQRMLGIVECLLFFIINGLILALSWREIIFVSVIFLVHYLCSPHLCTLHSFISPHLSRQHYSEADEHLESKILQGLLDDKTTQVIVLFIFLPIFYMLFTEVDIKWFYIVTTGWIFIIYGAVFCFIYIILSKLTPVVDKIDLK